MYESKQYFISINGKQIQVTEEVYLAYYRSKRRDRYYEQDIKTGTAIRDNAGRVVGYAPSKEDSLDRIFNAGGDFANNQESIEDSIIRELMSDALHKALDKLPEADRALINELFFSNAGDGMTERACAASFGISKTALHARKMKILVKLKNLLEKVS